MLRPRFQSPLGLIIAALLALLVVLSGCGGSDDNGTPTTGGTAGSGGTGGPLPTATPRIDIVWPERSRAIIGVSSAQSATVEFDSFGTVRTVNVNRPASTVAEFTTATAPSSLPVGPLTVRVRMYANTAQGGPLVGSASVAARLLESGELARADEFEGNPSLGDIQLVGTVATVTVADNQRVRIGSTQQLIATAFAANGDIIAVSPGSIIFSVPVGSGVLGLTPDGLATGLFQGVATVEAAVDGKVSAQTSVIVSPPPTTFSLNIDWPARSRNIQGLSSALSAKIELIDNGEVVFGETTNRPAGAAAVVQPFTSVTTTEVGPASLQVTLFANADGTGAVVGSATVPVLVTSAGILTRADGSPLGNVAVASRIASVVIAVDQQVAVGETRQISATAFDSTFGVVPLPVGALTFTTSAGASFLTVQPDGAATGVAVGTASVIASVDGVSSLSTTINVVP